MINLTVLLHFMPKVAVTPNRTIQKSPDFHRICENPVFVRSVLGFSMIFRFHNLHICDIELIRSIYAVIKMFTRNILHFMKQGQVSCYGTFRL